MRARAEGSWPRVALGFALAIGSAPVRAEPSRHELAATAFGLPGLDRIQLPMAAAPAVAVVATGGYGLTESQGDADGAHHRVLGSIGIGAALTPALGVGLRFDGRHDMHPDDGMGEDSGTVGDPRLLARYGFAPRVDLQLGFEAQFWVPGKDAPSLEFSALTSDLKLVFAYVPPDAALRVVAVAGYRFDQSGEAAPDPMRLRSGDRLALGLSDFDAVLVGVGFAHAFGALEALGEVTWDVLVGQGAPTATESPIRIALGARFHASRAIQLSALAAISPSGRPEQGPSDPLVPIEPRFGVQLAAAFRFGAQARAAADEREGGDEGAQADDAPRATMARVQGRLFDASGAPVAGARVRLLVNDDERGTESDEHGEYAFERVPFGRAEIAIEHEAYEPQTRDVTVGEAQAALPDTVLEASETVAVGQLRGLSLSWSGKPVQAQLRVRAVDGEGQAEDDGARELSADASGRFAVDLPPGRYEVQVSARGHRSQTRTVDVQAGGVVILNLDLRKAGR
jgi:hypothetical protein